MTNSIRFSALFMAGVFSIGAAARQDQVAYPEGYRQWMHVKTGLVASGNPATEGFHHIYANALAAEGYRTGHFPNGAIIVFDRLQAVTVGQGTTSGTRQDVGVMVRDSARYASTGGWGFEAFAGDSHTQRNIGQERAAAVCFNCHQRRQANEFVFSAMQP